MPKWRVHVDLLDDEDYALPERYDEREQAMNFAREFVCATFFTHTIKNGTVFVYPGHQLLKVIVREETPAEAKTADKKQK